MRLATLDEPIGELLREEFEQINMGSTINIQNQLKAYALTEEEPVDAQCYQTVLLRVFDILSSELEEGSATLVVVAPNELLRQLRIETVCKGKRTEELKGIGVNSEEFNLKNFAKHHEGDRDDSGLPTDGGFAVSFR